MMDDRIRTSATCTRAHTLLEGIVSSMEEMEELDLGRANIFLKIMADSIKIHEAYVSEYLEKEMQGACQ